MSDTHSLTSHINTPIPDGDVFVHAGDFTRAGQPSEVREFNNWLGKVRSPDTTKDRAQTNVDIFSSLTNTRLSSPATTSCVSILLSPTTQTGRVARAISGAARPTSTSNFSRRERTNSRQAPSIVTSSRRS